MSPPKFDAPNPGDDRDKWTRFYNELRAERDQLRQELLTMRENYHDLYLGFFIGKLESPYTMHEVLDFVAHRPSIQEIIDQLSRENS